MTMPWDAGLFFGSIVAFAGAVGWLNVARMRWEGEDVVAIRAYTAVAAVGTITGLGWLAGYYLG